MLDQSLQDEIDFKQSQSLDIAACESVCLALGQYRNLTTLTASTLFLHPNCQVLNHAGTRIFGNPRLDFLSSYSEDTFDNFVRYAIHISAKGRKGQYGGSILLSHAFDPGNPIQQLYSSKGGSAVKPEIRCLFWKESHRTSNLIRNHPVDMGSLFAGNARLRFLQPIRNPMDCAVSNLKTGHVALFHGLGPTSSVEDVTLAILDEILWFATVQSAHPERFMCFYEHEIGEPMFASLARFLSLDPTPSWITDAGMAMQIKPGYPHAESLRSLYRRNVEAKFAEFPEFASKLLLFAERP